MTKVVRIGIDLTALGRAPTGIVRYALELAKHLLQLQLAQSDDQGPRIEYVLFFSRAVHPELQALHSGFEAAICPFTREIWIKQLWFPANLARYRLDLIHYPAFPPPYPLLRPLCPVTFITLHDTVPWSLPRTLTFHGRLYFCSLLALSIRDGAWIITVSAHVRSELELLFGSGCLARTFVIPEAARTEMQAVQDGPVASRYRLPARYFLVLGTLEPRKNQARIVEAYSSLRMKYPTNCPGLVIVGRRGWRCRELLRSIERLGEDVIWLDQVPDRDLPSLYRRAVCLVFVSLYEGFGLPVLEAMQSGCAVITSATSALPEVAGDAAFLVNPFVVEEIAAAMQQLWLDPPFRSALIERGRQRAADFSWRKAACQTQTAYLNVLADQFR